MARGIVAVDLGRLPAEGLELVGQRIERRMRLGRAAEALEVVVVDEGDDVGAASSEEAIRIASQVEPSCTSPSLSTV